MGAKTCMIAFCDALPRETLQLRPTLDPQASHRLVEDLFRSHQFALTDEANLGECYPQGSEVYAGSFPSLSIVSAVEFAPDRPSTLDRGYLKRGGQRFAYLHAMHSVVDWFAYAIWEDGTLVRSLSVSPDTGVIEDLGPRREFEKPYWDGRHPAGGTEPGEDDDYPLPFHPLELGEAALLSLFGFNLEGPIGGLDPMDVPLSRFERKKKRWTLW